MASLHSQRGQATVDYVALIAILALLIGAATAVAGGGANGVTNAVVGQLRRALCVVTGGSCPTERRLPCVVAGERRSFHVAVSVAILRVDKDRSVLRERLSDGSVRLTLVQRSGVGAEVGAGGVARLKLGRRTVGFDQEVRGGGQGILGFGRVYAARDDREADEIVRAIMRPRLALGGDPRPREVFVEGGVRALGRLGISAVDAGAWLEATAEGVLGAKRDLRSGDVTISLRAGGSEWALLSAVLKVPSGSLDRDGVLELTFDRHRRPVELSLTAHGAAAAGRALAPQLPRPAGTADGLRAGMDGRRWELGARVDLRDPDVTAAWAAYRRDPTDRAAIRALGEQLRARARLDVRSYSLRSESDGVAAAFALGPRLGGEADLTRDHSRLLSAATRPPGGLWEQRMDCVAT